MTDFGVIIPARYASTRLPGKPLLKLAGRPMVQWVVENAQNAGAQFVWVATDDQRIADVVSDFGGEAIMTHGDHCTGTDRLAEVVQKRSIQDDTLLVNVQGDEPLLPPNAIRLVAQVLADDPLAGLATLATPITTSAELFTPHFVKVVLDEKGHASYFSRAPIPWVRDAFAHGPPQALPSGVPFLRHMGLYAYRAGTLRTLAALPAAPLEHAESLEQLRALHAQIPIAVAIVEEAHAAGVDTEEDLERVTQVLMRDE